ncbi:hypothetical protein MBIO_0615 [Mycoplasmopsis fermentans PG18]|uniref:Cytosine-specific methyltransferase n=1 Tax=Mycoplasmopsis fermentans (strain ATCC 19989 / NBRC 14854 / NCTC 10117 / PG18) TaxID=496833 RepID=C4XFF8_MYCFP|nr:DNA (cytosine-5-)-methyltransferase [Mycoplasmopsis fermentans]BAH69880.1 hypothetical protein MBIO_0615 [Mycoplasmopsis fermentans PG18]VEU63723.1 Cytosine-specific DNA methyltransferase/Type II site-specific deoxyribonuclease [Mycoplasmopsis fermentans]VEU67288.1 Cytosine-specific DNA methyltransferase/Type II site-specific deoxyribonuclease [Mesomycoplasma conjunctivae]
MQKIRIFETFSGIGAQHKAITWLNKKQKEVNFEIVAKCDWDIQATIAYAAIHHNLDETKIEKILNSNKLEDETKINEYLKSRTFSMTSKKAISSLKNKSYELKKALVAANLISNNFNDITKITKEQLDQLHFDLITYSFPCQGLSSANMGRSLGIKNNNSTSHLVWQIARVIELLENKPKYLLLENVQQLVTKYKEEYNEWKKKLNKLGYRTFTAVLNGKDHGSLQHRKRVFALSVRNDLKVPFKENDESYLDELLNFGKEREIKNKWKEFAKIFDLENKKEEESKEALIKKSQSRERMAFENKNYSTIYKNQKIDECRINTLTTKQDRHPNVGVLDYDANLKGFYNKRFVTNREAYKIMGFEDKDFEKVNEFKKKNIITKEALYRQAGNSICVPAIKSVFQLIAKIEEYNGGQND